MPPEISQFPFTKAKAFEDEREFRIIYENKNQEYITKKIPLDIKSIEKVVFNPWITEEVCASLKAVIRKIEGCDELEVIRTTVTNNEKWKKLGRDLLFNNSIAK